jgi:ribosomal protein S18 acetylase RimI-like enzyme
MPYPQENYDSHIRPIRLRTDINEVANLVDLCFAEHMDTEGRAYLQNIRRIGREGNPYYLDATSPESSPVPFHGYVWEENHRIIGNITLIYGQKNNQDVYFIANVSVDPNQRGQGIGHKLTKRALQHVREHRAKSVILQVREDNPIAIHLYESLGFYELTRRTTWGYDHAIEEQTIKYLNPIKLKNRSSEHWQQQKKWLQQLYPEKVTWFLPFSLPRYEPGFLNALNRWLNSESIHFYEALDGERLIGLATFEKINSYQDFIWIATSPAYEELSIPALASMIAEKSSHPQNLQLNYPAHRAVNAFYSAGFKELNTLIWMENTLSTVPDINN